MDEDLFDSTLSPLIGVMDSGVGGLSVLREIHRAFPDSPTLYFADQAHLPYGERDADTLRGYTESITDFLIEQGARGVVIACHSASADGLQPIRAREAARAVADGRAPIPFVGMEPAVKPAAQMTKSGVIGVVTTRATANGSLYRGVVERFAVGIEVITAPSPEWVALVESTHHYEDEGHAIVAATLEPMLARGADHIVLACTHFPFLLPTIHSVIDERAAVIDPGAAVARQVGRVLGMGEATAQLTTQLPPFHRYITSGDITHFRAQVRHLLGVNVPDSAFAQRAL